MKKIYLAFITFLFYIFTVLWFTFLNRSIGLHTAQFELFWSYKIWLAGDPEFGKEIVANIVMFIPFGLLMSRLLDSIKIRQTQKNVIVICSASFFSLMIEMLQLVFMRGLFEWDDVISNTIGSVIGVALHTLVMRRTYKKCVESTLCIIIILGCLAIIIKEHKGINVESDITPRVFCFQIDNVEYDDEVSITGFAFRYEHKADDFSVILRSTATGERIKLKTKKNVRPDVNEYFLCDSDYSESGFIASGWIDPKEEYEVMVKWSGIVSLSTGAYITGTKVHYVPEDKFTPLSSETDLDAIIEDGTLRVYRPEYHCWVYQVGTKLYWIVDDEFSFEEDGKTQIQCKVWTTQRNRLPNVQ